VGLSASGRIGRPSLSYSIICCGVSSVDVGCSILLNDIFFENLFKVISC